MLHLKKGLKLDNTVTTLIWEQHSLLYVTFLCLGVQCFATFHGIINKKLVCDMDLALPYFHCIYESFQKRFLNRYVMFNSNVMGCLNRYVMFNSNVLI